MSEQEKAPIPWHVELWAALLTNPTRAALFIGAVVAVVTYAVMSLTPLPNFGGDMPAPLTAIFFGLAFSFVVWLEFNKPY